MTQEAFRLVGIVEARTAAAEKDLHHVSQVAQSTANSMNKSLSGTSGGFFSAGRAADNFLSRFAHISQIIQGIPQIGALAGALTRPLFQAAEEGIRLNMVLEQAQIGFEQVAGSSEKAAQHLRNLEDFGQKSPFRFEGLLEASRLMTAFGFDLDEQIPKLKIWGNAIAASGELSAEKVQSVTEAFGKMKIGGRADAREMLELTRANIPAWELLAKAIGKTVEETRKLTEKGRINGPQAMEAITAMMAVDPRYKNMMPRLEKTTAGRLSAAEDALQFAQARATQGTTQELSKTLETALGRQDLISNLAGNINSMLTPVAGVITTAAKTMLGGGIVGGISEGIAAGQEAVWNQVGSLGQGMIDTLRDMFGIHSPSTVFMKMGEECAAGFNIGFAEGLNGGALDGVIDQFLGRMEGKLSATKKRSAENLAKLMQREPGFKDKLVSGSAQHGINPDDLLNVMATETAGTFRPSIRNPSSGATGLIQFMPKTAGALGTSTNALAGMSATDQLYWIFKYFDKFYSGKDLSSYGALYAAVGPGHVGSSPDSVLMTRNTRGYAGNAATWDPNQDGRVTQGELGQVAQSRLGAGVNFTVNGSLAVSNSNPMPVVFVGATGGAGSSSSARGSMGSVGTRDARGGANLIFGRPTATTFGTTGIAGNFSDANLQKIQQLTDKWRNANGQITTDTTKLATTVVPRATQEFIAMAGATEQAFKGAGQYAKDVITQSEEAVKRMKFDWNAVGSGFESAFQTLIPGTFTEGGKNAALHFMQSFAQSIGDEATRQLSSIISKSLFNFEGGSSPSDGGLFGNLVRDLFGKIGIGKKKPAASDGVQSAIDAAGKANAAAGGTGSAARAGSGSVVDRVATKLFDKIFHHKNKGSVPESGSPKGDGSKTPDNREVVQAIHNSSDKIGSAIQAQGNFIAAQGHADADHIVDALTPRSQGFLSGLLSTVLSAAAGAAAGGLVDKALHPHSDESGGSYSGTGMDTGSPKLVPFVPQHRALGGPLTAGGAYLFGENGPELGIFPANGTMLPNDHPATQMALGGRTGRGQTVHYHMPIHIHTTDAKGVQKSRAQIERQMWASLRNTAARAA